MARPPAKKDQKSRRRTPRDLSVPPLVPDSKPEPPCAPPTPTPVQWPLVDLQGSSSELFTSSSWTGLRGRACLCNTGQTHLWILPTSAAPTHTQRQLSQYHFRDLRAVKLGVPGLSGSQRGHGHDPPRPGYYMTWDVCALPELPIHPETLRSVLCKASHHPSVPDRAVMTGEGHVHTYPRSQGALPACPAPSPARALVELAAPSSSSAASGFLASDFAEAWALGFAVFSSRSRGFFCAFLLFFLGGAAASET